MSSFQNRSNSKPEIAFADPIGTANNTKDKSNSRKLALLRQGIRARRDLSIFVQAMLVRPRDHQAMHPATFALMDDIQPIALKHLQHRQHDPTLDGRHVFVPDAGSVSKPRAVCADQHDALLHRSVVTGVRGRSNQQQRKCNDNCFNHAIQTGRAAGFREKS